MHYMELMKERGEAFPVLYQEAICLFFAAVQKDPEAFRSFPISQEVQNRFLQFMKVARSMPPAALKLATPLSSMVSSPMSVWLTP